MREKMEQKNEKPKERGGGGNSSLQISIKKKREREREKSETLFNQTLLKPILFFRALGRKSSFCRNKKFYGAYYTARNGKIGRTGG